MSAKKMKLPREIHEKARLGILTVLFNRQDGCSFPELKSLCDLTDGNLSRHLKILQEKDLISMEKSFVNNKPHTLCQITSEGKEAFASYLQELEEIIQANKEKLVEWNSFQTQS